MSNQEKEYIRNLFKQEVSADEILVSSQDHHLGVLDPSPGRLDKIKEN